MLGELDLVETQRNLGLEERVLLLGSRGLPG